MTLHSIDFWRHDHDFAVIAEQGERRTLQVLVLTALAMVLEVGAGLAFGSMSLLADGWHMGTHVAAFMITLFAYRYARRHQNSSLFAFGPGKVSVLGGFASAVALVVVALIMVVESVQRLWAPVAIRFDEALLVAAFGLAVNLLSAFLLQGHHDHEHDAGSGHHHDHNLKAAYFHVLADALTSVLALAALLAGKFMGWSWLDPLIGMVGALVIAHWARGLLVETGMILLDGSMDSQTLAAIRKKVEADQESWVADMHVWRVGPRDYAAILSIVTHESRGVEYYRERLLGLPEFHGISHLTIELNICREVSCQQGRA